MAKIAIIEPGHNELAQEYVKKLEGRGHTVSCPTLEENGAPDLNHAVAIMEAIHECDEVHIYCDNLMGFYFGILATLIEGCSFQGKVVLINGLLVDMIKSGEDTYRRHRFVQLAESLVKKTGGQLRVPPGRDVPALSEFQLLIL